MKIKISDHPTFNKDWDRKKTEEKTKKMLKKIGKLQPGLTELKQLLIEFFARQSVYQLYTG